MTAALGTSTSRFKLESHDHAGNFVTSLPYRNVQHTCQLGSAGQTFTCEVPYRGYSKVTMADLYAGKHELWFYDNVVDATDPIFAGPVWDITASSSSGVLSVTAQDPLTYLAKRLLKAFKSYNTVGANMMNDLMTYINAIFTTNMVASIQTLGVTASQQSYTAASRNVISDLLETISQLNDKVDYFFRTVGGVHTLMLYGGLIKPATPLTLALDYGGSMDGYSVQFNAQTIANDQDELASNGVIGNAVSAAKKTEYAALYQAVESADQVTTTSLNATAATQLKAVQSTKVIPSLVTRKFVAIKDFDFGSQFAISIQDWYVQVQQTIRVVGWQTTVSQGDGVTTVIYTKDTEEVS